MSSVIFLITVLVDATLAEFEKEFLERPLLIIFVKPESDISRIQFSQVFFVDQLLFYDSNP